MQTVDLEESAVDESDRDDAGSRKGGKGKRIWKRERDQKSDKGKKTLSSIGEDVIGDKQPEMRLKGQPSFHK